MLDSRSAWSAGNHDDVWELIPWYVNGSLPPEDVAVIKRHISGCAECSLEVSRQRGLAGQIAIDETTAASAASAASASRSWKKLSAQIKAERDSRTQRSSSWNPFGGFRSGFMLGGACTAACLLAIITVMPADSGFRTLTSSTPAGSNTIRFQTVSGLTSTQLETILADHGLELVGGPSETGVYTAIATGSGVDPQAASKELMTAPQIIFAAPSE